MKCAHSDCTLDFKTIKELDNHISKDHDIEIEIEEKLFSSMLDFKEWKSKMEKEEMISYIYNSAPRKNKGLKHGCKEVCTRHYLHCHRSFSKRGVTKPTKCIASKKIEKACPSRMILKEYPNSVKLLFYKTHLGHDNDNCHLKLTKEDRETLAAKLLSGIPMKCIIDDVRNDALNSTGLDRRSSRIRQDLNNIKRDFKIRRRVSGEKKPTNRKNTLKINRKLKIVDDSNCSQTIVDHSDSSQTSVDHSDCSQLIVDHSDCSQLIVDHSNSSQTSVDDSTTREEKRPNIKDIQKTNYQTIVQKFDTIFKKMKPGHTEEDISFLTKKISEIEHYNSRKNN